MRGRRFMIVVAVLMGLTALAATLAPRQPASRNGQAADATPAPPPASGAASAVRTVQKEISIEEAPTRVVVQEGVLLELEVAGTELESVSLLDEVAVVAPGTNARFDILTDTPGSYPIELVDADRLVGTLVVRAAKG